jgi:hypothetical protein
LTEILPSWAICRQIAFDSIVVSRSRIGKGRASSLLEGFEDCRQRLQQWPIRIFDTTMHGAVERDLLAGANALFRGLWRTPLSKEGNSRYAVEIAQNLSHQLGVAKARLAELEPRVAELEAAVQFYRNRAERAEEWLGKISSEIQERVIGKTH